jgi:hypothetical protein
MLRTAVRRKSCGMRPGQPAPMQAHFHALWNGLIGLGPFAPPRPFATRKKTHGTRVADLPQFLARGLLRLEEGVQVVSDREHASVSTFVISGSSRISPATKSTGRHSTGNTSDGIRQP